jgi:hypothetical protein
MNIQISENYRIVTDKLNYILQERKVTDPNHKWSNGESKEKWLDVGYFSQLRYLADYLVDLEIRQEAINDLVSFDKRIEMIKIKLTNRLERLV